MAKKTNRGPTLEKLLPEISETLIDSIPETVSRCEVRAPVYALILAYQDYSTGDYTPQILLPPASVRAERLESQGVENGSCEIWMPMLLAQDVQEYACEGPQLAEKCAACYDLLSQQAPPNMDELAGLLPFREMLYRVALALNRQHWKKRLPITDDFVVAVSDWNGYNSATDVPASIPARKRDLLKQRQLLFYVDPADPYAIAQQRHQQFHGGNRLSDQEELQFWLLQIDRLLASDPAYVNSFSILWPKALDCLQVLGSQAALPLLQVVDKYADRLSDENFVLLGKALRTVGQLNRADEPIESLLLGIFQRAYRASQSEPDGPFWLASFPSDTARTLHKLFPRYPEPESAFDLNPEPYLRQPPRPGRDSG